MAASPTSPPLGPPEDVMAIFEEYKRAWAIKLDQVGSNNDLRVVELETMVDELLEHNGLLVSTIVDLQKEATSRAIQMERRLTVSARNTEEVVINLGRYERSIKNIVGTKLDDIEASSDMLNELTNHLEALKIENNYLRDKNENLKHDMGNLLEMVNFERSRSDQLLSSGQGLDASSSHSPLMSAKCLTFCDSVNPEDVYGPIESCSAYDEDDSRGFAITNSTEYHNQSSPISGLSSISQPTQEQLSLNHKGANGSPVSTNSATSAASNKTGEEKDLLIGGLQKNLQSLSKQIELKDEVISKIELKLNNKRTECEGLRKEIELVKTRLTEQLHEFEELRERVHVLNEHKRSLMTQLDEQSEGHLKSRAEANTLANELHQANQRLEYQSVTIEHMKEAIISKTKALSSNSSHSSNSFASVGLLSAPRNGTNASPSPSQSASSSTTASHKNGGLDNV